MDGREPLLVRRLIVRRLHIEANPFYDPAGWLHSRKYPLRYLYLHEIVEERLDRNQFVDDVRGKMAAAGLSLDEANRLSQQKRGVAT